MPYIDQHTRQRIDQAINSLVWHVDREQKSRWVGGFNAGLLNYILTRLLCRLGHPNSYTQINAVIGVLECVKLELYRRLAAPYEDTKIIENGDIPEYERNHDAPSTPASEVKDTPPSTGPDRCQAVRDGWPEC